MLLKQVFFSVAVLAQPPAPLQTAPVGISTKGACWYAYFQWGLTTYPYFMGTIQRENAFWSTIVDIVKNQNDRPNMPDTHFAFNCMITESERWPLPTTPPSDVLYFMNCPQWWHYRTILNNEGVCFSTQDSMRDALDRGYQLASLELRRFVRTQPEQGTLAEDDIDNDSAMGESVEDLLQAAMQARESEP